MEIKILGPGCQKCQLAERIVRNIVAETGVKAHIEKVTNIVKISEYEPSKHRR